MSNPGKSTALPVIAVFGVSAIGKPKAGTFKGSDISAARKAATKLGFAVVDLAGDGGSALMSKLPAGRIGGAGHNIVPFVSKDLYTQINAFQTKHQTNGQAKVALQTAKPSESSVPHLPRDWAEIKPGDHVLAQESDPKDGWWLVTITEANDDLLKLRWPGNGRGRPIQKHRLTFGLMFPIDGEKDASKTSPKKPNGKSDVAYPSDWPSIAMGHTVLAKEDGPVEQWWEARVVKADKDEMTIQWRDYPSLPSIVRPRFSLGLVHPAPTTR
ncbi:MAG TPA: hypothetical protein VH206_01305 [Xanthobacteraceae bacterium]|jgi:hypothetical protein|nr:hypothetical protein [Xanthobacteraceae bacterium]